MAQVFVQHTFSPLLLSQTQINLCLDYVNLCISRVSMQCIHEFLNHFVSILTLFFFPQLLLVLFHYDLLLQKLSLFHRREVIIGHLKFWQVVFFPELTQSLLACTIRMRLKVKRVVLYVLRTMLNVFGLPESSTRHLWLWATESTIDSGVVLSVDWGLSEAMMISLYNLLWALTWYLAALWVQVEELVLEDF